jgi:hypothetical protein
MARLWIYEPVQSRQFFVIDAPTKLEDYDLSESVLPTRLGPVSLLAGMTTVSVPDVTVETQMITEAIFDAPVDVAMGVNFSSITLTRGVYLIDAEFYDWIRMFVRGETYTGMFRRDLLVVWFHERQEMSDGVPLPIRVTLCRDVIPIRYKGGSDFDANSSEISIQELELKPRDFENIDPGQLVYNII